MTPLALLALVASGCATTAATSASPLHLTQAPLPAAPPVVMIARSSVAEPASPSPGDAALQGVSAPSPQVVRKVRPLNPPKDVQLSAGFLRFATRAEKERAPAQRGSVLPRGHHENWKALLEDLDAYLARPVPETTVTDLRRARRLTESELSHDAHLFGDFPASLADGVIERLALMDVRVAELKRLAEAQSAAVDDGLFAWPVTPVKITSLFGSRRHPITRRVKPHRGVDLDAKKGQPVFAAARGVVVKAGSKGGHGLQVTVEHPSGLTTRYSHLSRVLVKVGMELGEGEVLGLAGRTGKATGVHLHFEVWRDRRALDPLEFLREIPDPPNLVSSRS